jgi:transcriptional regulator GlxA family with amidase domain
MGKKYSAARGSARTNAWRNTMAVSKTRNVGILLYEGVEILDFAGPYEVLFAASFGEGHPFEVFTIAADQDLVACTGNLLVKPRHSIDDHPPIDILVIPGGGFSSSEPAGRRVVEWIREREPSIEIVTSVCTGSYLLGKAGILSGQRATSHWGAIEWLRQKFPDVEFVDDQRVIDAGHVITAAGVSAGIDMALHLVERICGKDEAEKVARYMEYDWQPRKVAMAAHD